MRIEAGSIKKSICIVKRWLWVSLALLLVACSNTSAVEESPPLPIDTTPRMHQEPTPVALADLEDQTVICAPKVKIISPQPDQLFQERTVSAQFMIKGMPLFKDPDLGLGPHLQVVLDHYDYREIYDLNEPVVFENLDPGSHTLRVFAERPWHESFKNSGAYDQVTFHIWAPTPDTIPQPDLPLLTYNSPKDHYGAEPILLDFWLANAPIRESLLPNVPKDWRVRYSLNGDYAYLDQWESIYLSGLRQGRNLVTVELVDSDDEPIRNLFNSTVYEIDYSPGGQDTLSKLVRGDLKADDALNLINFFQLPSSSTVAPETLEEPTAPEPLPNLDSLEDLEIQSEVPTVDLAPNVEPDVDVTTEPETLSFEETPDQPLLENPETTFADQSEDTAADEETASPNEAHKDPVEDEAIEDLDATDTASTDQPEMTAPEEAIDQAEAIDLDFEAPDSQSLEFEEASGATPENPEAVDQFQAEITDTPSEEPSVQPPDLETSQLVPTESSNLPSTTPQPTSIAKRPIVTSQRFPAPRATPLPKVTPIPYSERDLQFHFFPKGI